MPVDLHEQRYFCFGKTKTDPGVILGVIIRENENECRPKAGIDINSIRRRR
jgi:hypothetical protein